MTLPESIPEWRHEMPYRAFLRLLIEEVKQRCYKDNGGKSKFTAIIIRAINQCKDKRLSGIVEIYNKYIKKELFADSYGEAMDQGEKVEYLKRILHAILAAYGIRISEKVPDKEAGEMADGILKDRINK